MRRANLGRGPTGQDPEALGDEAVPVVRKDPERRYLWPVLAVGLSDDPDGGIDWDQLVAMVDDRNWSYLVTRAPFSWQLFTMWWVARRYIEPRDVRKR